MSLLANTGDDKFLLLQAAYSTTMAELTQTRQIVKEAQNKIANLEAENARLKEQLQLLLQDKFGKKSEVHIGEPIVAPNVIIQTVSGYTRKKGNKSRGRSVDTSELLRYKIYHDLAEHDKTCKCCNQQLTKIGEDVSEQLEVLPMQVYVVEHIRYKYAKCACNTVVMAPKPPAPIPKSLAGGSLLTEIIINKYSYHLPLYRQSKILSYHNVAIPDNTLGNWVMQAGEGLLIIYEALWQALLTVKYLQVDETPVKILKPDKKGYLWTYFAPHLGTGVVIFELSLTRSGTTADNRLAAFKGLLQTDGYKGYDKLRARKDITNIGCLTHARRKFSEVLKVSKNSGGISSQVIEQLKPVYAAEERWRQMNVDFRLRKRLRQKHSLPLLKKLRSWLKQKAPHAPPKSKLAQACYYMLNQWSFIIMSLRHGYVELDTNWVENRIRNVALGRKNWLFMGNEDSGKINSLWFTLIISAELNGLNPRVYIHYLLMHIHDLRKGLIDPKTLLPHTIDRNKLEVFAKEQIDLAKRILDGS